jgi:voltage-gated potassium channel
MSGAQQSIASARERAFDILEHGRRRDLTSRILDWILVGLIIANVTGTLAQTLPEVEQTYGDELQLLDRICVLVFAIEYVARLWVAPEHPLLHSLSPTRARLRFAATPMMVIDALAFVPFVLELMFPGVAAVRLTRLVRFLKLARYSPALATIGRVVALERRALLACVIILGGVMMAAAAAMHVVEGHIQPDRLGDMSKSMWWSAAMLAKIGGVELEPMTATGRIIAAITVMLGIFCFALPVAIIGRGFYEEIRRRDFVVTFAMVAHVPLFAHLDAAAISDLVGILKARTIPAGTVIIRKGEPGDSMYLIASGAVQVDTADGKVRLNEGDFFGEVALLTRERRTATVTTIRSTDVLILDCDDFHRFIDRNPQVGKQVRAVAQERKNGPVARTG